MMETIFVNRTFGRMVIATIIFKYTSAWGVYSANYIFIQMHLWWKLQ